jgi:hypothetical protein
LNPEFLDVDDVLELQAGQIVEHGGLKRQHCSPLIGPPGEKGHALCEGLDAFARSYPLDYPIQFSRVRQRILAAGAVVAGLRGRPGSQSQATTFRD